MSEAPVKEELDEEEPEEITPEQERELPGPVQLYLREIGAVPLLKAADEVRLSKEIEHGRLLARMQRELVANGEHLTYETLAHYVLKRVRFCATRLSSMLEISDGKPSEVLFSPQLQRAISGPGVADALLDAARHAAPVFGDVDGIPVAIGHLAAPLSLPAHVARSV